MQQIQRPHVLNNDRLKLAIRFCLVLCFLVYSTAKILGLQFISSGITLDKPVGELSGMQLTWVYFGYSSLFAWFVAGGQAVSAILLAFDRTARLGAAILLPITTSLVAINFAFSIGPDTQILSVVLLLMNLYLIASDLAAWKRFLWDETAPASLPAARIGRPFAGWTRGAGLATTAAAVWMGMSLVARANVPNTPMRGDWKVVAASVDGGPATVALGSDWRKICFEDFGQFGVRTNVGYFGGEYTIDLKTHQFTAHYDPHPMPPRPAFGPVDSDSDIRRWAPTQFAGFQWPVAVTGSYRKEGDRLMLSGTQDGHRFEWTLARWTRPKF